MLADLYGQHGSRLLEGNVRSYLSNRGKVNKGIRATVITEPEQFLAYNNGITATATGVESRPRDRAIVRLHGPADRQRRADDRVPVLRRARAARRRPPRRRSTSR